MIKRLIYKWRAKKAFEQSKKWSESASYCPNSADFFNEHVDGWYRTWECYTEIARCFMWIKWGKYKHLTDNQLKIKFDIMYDPSTPPW